MQKNPQPMTKLSIVLLMAVLLAAASGCSRNAELKELATHALGISDIGQIKADAKAMWKNHPDAFDIDEEDWPESFSVFQPIRVWRSDNGISIIMGKFVSKTAGVFISINSNTVPKSLSNSDYEALAEGIYWNLVQ